MRRRDIPHSKERIRRKRNYVIQNTTLIVFALILFVGTLVWILSDERVRISRIDVSGNVVIQDHEIEDHVNEVLNGKYLFLFPRDSVFLYPRKEIYDSVRSDFKRILKLEVERKNLTVLSIQIEERQPHALWCGDEYRKIDESSVCYFLDAGGYIFSEAPQFTGSAYFEFFGPHTSATTTEKISDTPIGTQYRTPLEFEKINQFKENLERLSIGTRAMAALPFGDYVLYMNEGGKVFWNIKREPLDLASDFEAAYRIEMGDPNDSLTREKIEYIDMRFENKVFFKKK